MKKLNSSPSDDGLEPQKHLGFLLRRAQQKHLELWSSTVSSKVSGIQYSVLAVLERKPNISQRELGDELDLERSTINDLVLRLERRRLISRSLDSLDKRRKVLQITQLGKKTLEGLVPAVEILQQHLSQELNPHEVAELQRLLRVVID